MNDRTTLAILKVVERAPQWIRADLISKDATLRGRAEESLAAMIASALGDETENATAA